MTPAFSRPDALVAVAMIVTLTGCPGPMLGSAASPSVASSAERAPGAAHPPGKSRTLYVADDTDVIVYPADENNPPPLRKITDGVNQPQGLAVDRNGVLYVANSLANTVTEYRPGESHPFKTISKGIDDPSGLAVDSQGTIYVGNRNLAPEAGAARRRAATPNANRKAPMRPSCPNTFGGVGNFSLSR